MNPIQSIRNAAKALKQEGIRLRGQASDFKHGVTKTNYLGDRVEFKDGRPTLESLQLPGIGDRASVQIYTFESLFPNYRSSYKSMCYMYLALAYLQNPSKEILDVYNSELKGSVDEMNAEIDSKLGDDVLESGLMYFRRHDGQFRAADFSEYNYPFSPHGKIEIEAREKLGAEAKIKSDRDEEVRRAKGKLVNEAAERKLKESGRPKTARELAQESLDRYGKEGSKNGRLR